MVPQIEVQEYICRCRIYGRTTEPYSHGQNISEGMIKILKDKSKCRRIRWRVPKHIWYFGLVWEAEIDSRTAVKYGRTPMEILAGDTIDISEWTEFYFYNLFWYWGNHTDKTEGNIGRWIGVSRRVGISLC